MSTLHLVFTAPTAGSALDDCLRAAQKGDAVLLLQDGVYAVAAPPTSTASQAAGVSLNALAVDAQARGLDTDNSVQLVDDAGFVALTEQHARVVSWF